MVTDFERRCKINKLSLSWCKRHWKTMHELTEQKSIIMHITRSSSFIIIILKREGCMFVGQGQFSTKHNFINVCMKKIALFIDRLQLIKKM
jgi:hypothetical protein